MPLDEMEPIELGRFPLSVYAAMFGGTVGGQFAGMVLDRAAGHHALWVPSVCSMLLEALAGWYFASRARPVLSRADWWRLSAIYSIAIAVLTVPLGVWAAMAHAPSSPFPGRTVLEWVVAGLAVLAVATVVRWGIMVWLAEHASRHVAGGKGTH